MLIVILLLAIGFIVLSTSKWKLHPFLALLVAAYGIAFSVGMKYEDIAKGDTISGYEQGQKGMKFPFTG